MKGQFGPKGALFDGNLYKLIEGKYAFDFGEIIQAGNLEDIILPLIGSLSVSEQLVPFRDLTLTRQTFLAMKHRLLQSTVFT